MNSKKLSERLEHYKNDAHSLISIEDELLEPIRELEAKLEAAERDVIVANHRTLDTQYELDDYAKSLETAEATVELLKAQNAVLLEQVNVARIEELEALLDAWCRWDDGPSRDMLRTRINELKQGGDGK